MRKSILSLSLNKVFLKKGKSVWKANENRLFLIKNFVYKI